MIYAKATIPQTGLFSTGIKYSKSVPALDDNDPFTQVWEPNKERFHEQVVEQ
jgi:hypothetical protein